MAQFGDFPPAPSSSDEPETGGSQAQKTDTAREATTAPACPLRRVLAVNRNGLVVESARPFELGSTLVLACHVDPPASASASTGASGKAGESAARGSVFISAEAVVVESQPRTVARASRQSERAASGRGDSSSAGGVARSFQVTLLFSDISAEDRERLVNLSSVEGIRLSQRRSGLAIPPPEVFSIAGGDGDERSANAGIGGAERRRDGDGGSTASCSLN